MGSTLDLNPKPICVFFSRSMRHLRPSTHALYLAPERIENSGRWTTYRLFGFHTWTPKYVEVEQWLLDYLRGCVQGRAFSWVPSQNTQNYHIWPKPRFSGPEPGFGPDEVIFGCFGGVCTKRDHIWPKPMVLGPELGLGQMW